MVQAVPTGQTTQTTITTSTQAPVQQVVQAPVVQQAKVDVINKGATVTNVVDKAVLGNIIEKQNVEVVHRPIIQEIHEQKIIELEKQNIVRNVQQDQVMQRTTDQTRYEEIGNVNLELERQRLSQLNVTSAPTVTRQAGGNREIRENEVLAQVVRQEVIEHHVQPVITEVREQNLVKEVLHPVVRTIHDQVIIREVPSTQKTTTMNTSTQQQPLMQQQFNTQFQQPQMQQQTQFQQTGMQQQFQPTQVQQPIQQQFNSQFARGTWEHDNHLWEQKMLGAQQSLGNTFNRESWMLSNPAPLRQSYPVTTTQTFGDGLINTERSNLMQHESKLAGQGALMNPLERQNMAVHEKAVDQVLSQGNIGPGGAPIIGSQQRPAF